MAADIHIPVQKRNRAGNAEWRTVPREVCQLIDHMRTLFEAPAAHVGVAGRETIVRGRGKEAHEQRTATEARDLSIIRFHRRPDRRARRKMRLQPGVGLLVRTAERSHRDLEIVT